jgi:hypothetical protein
LRRYGDGSHDEHYWNNLVEQAKNSMKPDDRPLIGDNVLRVWRENRQPHTLSKTHSTTWDVAPAPDSTAINEPPVQGSDDEARNAEHSRNPSETSGHSDRRNLNRDQDNGGEGRRASASEGSILGSDSD